jgi:hypothetical protein
MEQMRVVSVIFSYSKCAAMLFIFLVFFFKRFFSVLFRCS